MGGAFITVTDSLTREPVIVNAAQIRAMWTRRGDPDTTVIDIGGGAFIQCTQSLSSVYVDAKSALSRG